MALFGFWCYRDGEREPTSLRGKHLLLKTQVILGRNHTNGVGVAHTTAPSLNTDDAGTLLDNTKLDTVVDTPLQTTVDVYLPDLDVEVRLALGEVEGVDTAVQVRIPGSGLVTGDHDDRANGAVLGEETGGLTTVWQKVNDLR